MQVDAQGLSPLHCAACAGAAAVIELLLGHAEMLVHAESRAAVCCAGDAPHGERPHGGRHGEEPEAVWGQDLASSSSSSRSPPPPRAVSGASRAPRGAEEAIIAAESPWLPMHAACFHGRLDCVLALARRGGALGDLEAPAASNKLEPLHWACQHGQKLYGGLREATARHHGLLRLGGGATPFQTHRFFDCV